MIFIELSSHILTDFLPVNILSFKDKEQVEKETKRKVLKWQIIFIKKHWKQIMDITQKDALNIKERKSKQSKAFSGK